MSCVHDTNQLFSAEEAFVRLGQSRERGCLVVVSPEATIRLFVEDGFVVKAIGEKSKGETALQEALALPNSSYVWIPRVVTKDKTIHVNITAYTIKHSIARDTKVGATGKVALPATEAGAKKPADPAAAQKAAPKGKVVPTDYYLVAEGYSKEDLRIRKATTIIGRDPTCDIVMQNVQVSRRHCLLDIQVRGIYLRDLGSTNGIKINGIAAAEGFVNCGDQIEFGSYKVKILKD